MQQVRRFVDNCLRSHLGTQTCPILARVPTEWSCKYMTRGQLSHIPKDPLIAIEMDCNREIQSTRHIELLGDGWGSVVLIR